MRDADVAEALRDVERALQLDDPLDRQVRRRARRQVLGVRAEEFRDSGVFGRAGREIEAHDVRQEQPVAGAVRNLDQAAEGVLERVDEGQARVDKRHAGQRRGEGHARARGEVLGLAMRGEQVRSDEADRLFGVAVAEHVAALVDRRVFVGDREVEGVDHGERFDRVDERVDAGVGGDLLGARQRQRRIDNREARAQMPAEGRDLEMIFLVGEDARATDFAAGAGRGWNTNQRRHRAGDFVFANVIPRAAAVREDGGGDLGQVEIAPAAQTEDRVGPVRAGRGDALVHEGKAGLGLAAVVFTGADAVLGERVVDALGRADTDELLVGDDKDLAPRQPRGPQADLLNGAGSKDNSSGSFVSPSGAHGLLGVGRWARGAGRK